MKKLLREKVVKTIAVRGGHGWVKPDPPITEQYIHKRGYSITISGSMMTLLLNTS